MLCLVTLSTSLCAAPPVLSSSNISDLGPLETKFFAHQYGKESPADRLNRLESLVFGKSQDGSVDERVSRLTAAVPVTAVAQNQSSNAAPKSPAAKPDAQTKTASKSVVDTYNYPKVTELEQSILGKTYKNEPVRDRLSRLESKAYGAPSTADDLALRVDKLSNYARNYGMQSDDLYLNPTASASSSAASAGSSGMIERVSAMENKVFGRSNTGQALTHRIKNLETKVYGKSDGSNSNDDMSARVNRLWVAVQADQQQQPVASNPLSFPPTKNSPRSQYSNPFANSGSSQSPIAINNPYAPTYASGGGNPYNKSNASDPYAPSNPYGMKNPYNVSANKHQKNKYKNKSSHGSFLGTIGKVVVGAGSVAVGAGALAVSAVGSSGGGYYGGGYGTGFGVPSRSYGGYGMNSFGSPYASSYAGSFFSR